MRLQNYICDFQTFAFAFAFVITTMGGCRCTFRDCENGTASRKELHYFRYPVRDQERLIEWAKNADRLEYVDLPVDKVSNKVVCQEHFERKMFMNDLRDRLTKMAIPRLMLMPDETIVNVETGSIYIEGDCSSSVQDKTVESVQTYSPHPAMRQVMLSVIILLLNSYFISFFLSRFVTSNTNSQCEERRMRRRLKK